MIAAHWYLHTGASTAGKEDELRLQRCPRGNQQAKWNIGEQYPSFWGKYFTPNDFLLKNTCLVPKRNEAAFGKWRSGSKWTANCSLAGWLDENTILPKNHRPIFPSEKQLLRIACKTFKLRVLKGGLLSSKHWSVLPQNRTWNDDQDRSDRKILTNTMKGYERPHICSPKKRNKNTIRASDIRFLLEQYYFFPEMALANHLSCLNILIWESLGIPKASWCFLGCPKRLMSWWPWYPCSWEPSRTESLAEMERPKTCQPWKPCGKIICQSLTTRYHSQQSDFNEIHKSMRISSTYQYPWESVRISESMRISSWDLRISEMAINKHLENLTNWTFCYYILYGMFGHSQAEAVHC